MHPIRTSSIDLTGEEDPPINPLVPLKPTRKQKRPIEVDLEASDQSDSDFEEVVVYQKPKSTQPKRQRRKTSNDEIEVTEQKTLTAEDRLKQIQEKHNRGEIVRLPSRQPVSRPPSILSFMSGGLFNTFNTFNNWTDHGLSTIEDEVMRRALHMSMDNYSDHRQVSAEKLKNKPKPMAPEPGFTNSLDTKKDLVCILCDNVLGESQKDANTEYVKTNSAKVFVRGCGHVYCGLCVSKLKSAPTNKRACPVKRCKSVPSHKKGKFREIYL